MKVNKIVCIDAGHGVDTKGKRSPDESLREYKYCRDIAKQLSVRLERVGIGTYIVVPEEYDLSINNRVKRVNSRIKQNRDGGICVSIHNNAAGSDGNWRTASGWECLIAPNASQSSKTLARCLYEAAENAGVKVRKNTETVPYKTMNLGICRDTNCPAVLVENFFMDNKEECAWLLSEKGKNTVVDILFNGIKMYLL